MKRIVNGVEVEIVPSGAPIRSVGDRLMVTTPDGVYSAVAIRRGDSVLVSYRGRQYTVEPVKTKRTHAGKDHSGDLISSLPVRLWKCLYRLESRSKWARRSSFWKQ